MRARGVLRSSLAGPGAAEPAGRGAPARVTRGVMSPSPLARLATLRVVAVVAPSSGFCALISALACSGLAAPSELGASGVLWAALTCVSPWLVSVEMAASAGSAASKPTRFLKDCI